MPDACTLPTAQQPLRLAGFDALFATALAVVRRPEPTRLRLILDADDGNALYRTSTCLRRRSTRWIA